ncbi:MAG: glycine cleavage system aminomethyltransferase GcvT [Hyphomonadaceae bacterium]
MTQSGDTPLKKTPLHALHVELGARMGEFAGYDMPIQYPEGVLAEHNWTRASCGLFDVSHMGPCFLALPEIGGGDAAHAAVSAIIESLVPSDIAGLAPGRNQLSVLLNSEGGILDDLMICRPAAEDRQGMLYVIVNAGTKEQDFALIEQAAAGKASLRRADDRGLLAVQGPKAEAVVDALFPGAAELSFMEHRRIVSEAFGRVVVSRCGYTGEDGYEILVFREHADALARKLLSDDRVKPIGLGARDSLRLEAGLCLYGHDLDAGTTPVEASLTWLVSKSRRARADFPGAERILSQIKDGAPRKRVGIRPLGRAPAREGVEIQTDAGETIGVVTSGGFGPTLNAPMSMGYVAAGHTKPGTPVKLIVRGKPMDAEIAALPFVPHTYKR